MRKTRDGHLEFADNSKDMCGCIGFNGCTYSLANAIENAEVPDTVFCMEGCPKHLARTDSPCEIHPGTTNGFRQVISNLVKLQVEVRKASGKPVREGANMPILRIMGFQNERPFIPVTIHSGLEFSTVVQGTGEIKGEDVQQLPKYVQLLSKQVFEKRSKPLGLPPASQKVSIAQSTLNKTNVSLLATVIKKVKDIDSFMANKGATPQPRIPTT
jgi:hypothetical protein